MPDEAYFNGRPCVPDKSICGREAARPTNHDQQLSTVRFAFTTSEASVLMTPEARNLEAQTVGCVIATF